MIANMEQQFARWQGSPVPLDSGGAAPPHYPHTADSEYGPPLSGNDQVSMISRKMDKADRGVSQPNETRSVQRGK